MQNYGDRFNAALAEELRAQRGRLGMTFAEIEKLSGVPSSTAARYLSGGREIPVPAFIALCAALNLSPIAMFELAENSTQKD